MNITSELLLAIVPQTTAWSTNTCFVMVSSNALCVVLARYVIQVKGTGPSLPLGKSFSGFGLPELLAATSLGHIVGVGAILGLSYIEILT